MQELLKNCWKTYTRMTPSADRIKRLFKREYRNDHIALRTFDVDGMSLDWMAQAFKDLGYSVEGHYEFQKKGLIAKHYEAIDKTWPKIFVSELKVEQFSSRLQKTVNCLSEYVRELRPLDRVVAGRVWPASYAIYRTLLEESEYAAWVYAFGFVPNHFTLAIDDRTLLDLAEELQAQGFSMNTSGGLIKGSPAQYLEQCSTLADRVEVEFKEGSYLIPSCYFEFVKRYPLPNGELFQGFIEKSADKIFESTDSK